MSKQFHGRPIVTKYLEGTAIVSQSGFNTLASFYDSLNSNSKIAHAMDATNKELYKKVITGKILCIPKTIGSTSAGSTWEEISVRGIGPKAILFSGKVDSLAAAGIALSKIWTPNPIFAIDQLGEEFLQTVQDGDKIRIFEDGKVEINQE
jgi:uncharacterized protein